MNVHYLAAALRSISMTDSVSQPTSQGISDSGNWPGPTSRLIVSWLVELIMLILIYVIFQISFAVCVCEDLQSVVIVMTVMLSHVTRLWIWDRLDIWRSKKYRGWFCSLKMTPDTAWHSLTQPDVRPSINSGSLHKEKKLWESVIRDPATWQTTDEHQQISGFIRN